MTPEQMNVVEDVYGLIAADLNIFYVDDHIRFLEHADPEDNDTFEFFTHGFRIFLETDNVVFSDMMKAAHKMSDLYCRRFAPTKIGHRECKGVTVLYVEYTFRKNTDGRTNNS